MQGFLPYLQPQLQVKPATCISTTETVTLSQPIIYRHHKASFLLLQSQEPIQYKKQRYNIKGCLFFERNFVDLLWFSLIY